MSELLIIDDDRLVRLTLEQMAIASGHHVWVAASGKDGIDICSDNPIDVVITDVLMPGMDGIQVLLAIKKLRPAVKVIVISGGGRTGTKDFLILARQLGADGVLYKPFDEDQLAAILAKVTAPTAPSARPTTTKDD